MALVGNSTPKSSCSRDDLQPGAPGKAASVAAVMGSVGGMLLPWLQGIVLVYVSLNANAWFVAAATLGMLLRRLQSSGASSEPPRCLKTTQGYKSAPSQRSLSPAFSGIIHFEFGG